MAHIKYYLKVEFNRYVRCTKLSSRASSVPYSDRHWTLKILG